MTEFLLKILVGIVLSLFTFLISLTTWLVKSTFDAKSKRHEQAARIILLSDCVDKLSYQFDKLREKVEEFMTRKK